MVIETRNNRYSELKSLERADLTSIEGLMGERAAGVSVMPGMCVQ
jgi:hypothetical protein